MPKVRSFTVLPALPSALKDLQFIAANMLWSWDQDFINLFKRIDSNLWTASGHNPIKMLADMTQQQFEALADNQPFVCELQRAAEKLRLYLERPTWFDTQNKKISSSKSANPSTEKTGGNDKPTIAYFSAEFGIHESLPIYAGGLGALAADYLKSASDLGIPVIGVGLLYKKGYFRQYLNIDGWQQETYLEQDFYNMPLQLVRAENGRPLTIAVEFPDRPVHAQIWCVCLGRVKLYLLDTNIPDNAPADRLITAVLYGGDREMRIRQEIILGIGGLRALQELGITPAVCHMNEGHAAFLALERIRDLRASHNLTFDEALEAAKAGNVFTLHTPVKAGLDEFPVQLMDKYFANYLPQLGIDRNRFLALGRILIDDDNETFKMPILAIRLSSFRNGVSQVHGQVSRQMWASLWPGLPVDEVPITSVTNGIHIKTWLSEEMNSLFETYLGPNWSDRAADEAAWNNIDQIPDHQLWRTHQRCKEQLIAFARKRLKAQMQRRGTYHTELNWAEQILDPEALTIGFARRFAAYKRGNLLLIDPQRITKILTNPDRPVQLIFAGKAHPKDSEGKEIIRQIIHFANQYEVRRRIVFLEDYDINLARTMVRGVDVWLNTPRKPLEASGTSGMKAAVNGALNMSTLDGWWPEGYKPNAGWAIGSTETFQDCIYQDTVESQAIYNLLEKEIVPLFYTRSEDNLPRAWIQRVKNSIKAIAPRFNTHRMACEYTQNFYISAIDRWKSLTQDACSKARLLASWTANVKSAWPNLAVRDVQIQLNNGRANEKSQTDLTELKVGSKLKVRALVKLANVTPDDVSVELYHGPVDSWGNITKGSAVRMNYEQNSGQDGEHWFAASMACRTTGQQGLAVRLLPSHPELLTPYESGLIRWETPA